MSMLLNEHIYIVNMSTRGRYVGGQNRAKMVNVVFE